MVIRNAKACLVAMIASSLLNLPARAAANPPPLGRVVAAQDARLASATAVTGANLYSGDTIQTDSSGSLRVKVGTTEVYLLGSSSSTLSQEEGKVRAQLKAGTLGFSTGNPDEFEVETPAGLVHGMAGARAFGQLSLLGPNHVVISAYQGTLVLQGKCGSHAINAGENYDVTASVSEPCSSQVVHATTNPINGRDLALGAAAAGALAGIFLIRGGSSHPSETCSNTTSC
jgi:hypothetical protein